MMSSPMAIFITGITGCQGGAVAHAALEQGWRIRAVARDPASAAATALTSLGAVITPGDWDDEAALARGLTGCDALFLNLFPSFTDASAEQRQAMSILRLAKAAGVRHVVYSSLLHRPSALPNPGPLLAPLQAMLDGFLQSGIVDGKGAVDDAVRTNALDFQYWTILRPGFFMANMLAPKCAFYGDFAATGLWTTVLRPVDRLPLTDHADIARFAVAALADPQTFHGREVQVASELRTAAELVAAVSAAAGKRIRVHHLEDDAQVLEAVRENPMLVGQLRSRNMATGVDLDNIRAWGIPLTSLHAFLEREGQAVRETYMNLFQ